MLDKVLDMTLLVISTVYFEHIQYYINPSHATDLFLYSLKISENQRFFDIFRGYIKTSLA